MNLSLFVARKLAFGEKNSISSTIIKIAIAAVGLSVAVIIISVFMIKGFQTEISEKVFGFYGHIDILSYESSDELSLSPLKNYDEYLDEIRNINEVVYIDEEGQEQKTHEGIRHIQKYILYPAIIKSKTEYEGIGLKGVGSDFDFERMKKYLVEGVFPDFGNPSALKKIVISKLTADRLNLDVGDKVIGNFFKKNDQRKKALKVAGIYNTGLAEYDKKLALVDINLLRDILGWGGKDVGGVELFVDDINDMDVLSEYIHVELLPADVQAITIRQKNPMIFEWLALQNVNERVILILMLIVSIINMMTALLILILEKTNMIGILKSMGMKSWSIRRIFLYHGAYIVLFGLIVGNVLGLGFCFLQKYFGFIKLDESSYYLSEAPIYFDFGALLLINIGTLMITVLSLIIPSFLISKIDPVKAIRFK